MPKVSIVIPCYNAAATLKRQLDALAAQATTVTWEVLVADNRSTDGSANIVKELDDTRFLLIDASEVQGPSHARNQGIRSISPETELVLFCDADDVVHPGWIEAYWQAYCGGADFMAGVRRVVNEQGRELGWVRKCAFMKFRGFLPAVASSNFSLSRKALEETGLFDESMPVAEDVDFSWRAQLAGFPLTDVDDAVIDYYTRSSAIGTFKQFRNYGHAHVALYVKYRPQGMPRANPLKTISSIFRALASTILKCSLHPIATALGTLKGHIDGTREFRVFYI